MVKLIASDIDGTLLSYGETSLPPALFGLIRRLRSAGVQIEALIEYASLYRQGEGTEARRKEILVEQRAQLLDRMGEMQRSLDRLNYKIENYEKVLRGKGMPKQ